MIQAPLLQEKLQVKINMWLIIVKSFHVFLESNANNNNSANKMLRSITQLNNFNTSKANLGNQFSTKNPSLQIVNSKNKNFAVSS
jgi:hypothetical protein